MLEQLRRNSRSVIIWALFLIIIASFVVTFGTQSEVNTSCGGTQSNEIMAVDGQAVEVHSWRLGMNSTQAGMSKLFRSQQVLDKLLEREILAQAAEDAGFRVTTEMATDKILAGEFSILGSQGSGSNFYFRNGVFDYDVLLAQVNAWGLPTIDAFIEQQKRELLAAQMRRLILSSAVASPEEARARLVYENTKASLDVLQFRPADYRSKLELTDADIDAYLAAHEEEVRKKYEEQERTYKDVGKQAKVRQIMFRRQQPAAAAGDAVGESETDPGEVAAREASEKLAAGADFATLAREVSQDERSKRKGGDLGWKSVESPGLGATELADALKTLEPGQTSDVIATRHGFFILKVEGEREGDLSFADVKRELAERMAPESYAREAARRDAAAALARAQSALAEGKTLEDVFERQIAPPPSQPGLNNIPSDMSPEELQQLIQQLQQQQQGSLIMDGPNMPAEAPLQADAPAQGAATTQGATAQQAGPQTGGPAAGQTQAAQQTEAAGTAPAAGAAAPAAAGAIPVPADLVTPKLRKVGPFTRDPEGTVPGVGKSKELVEAAFDELTTGQVTEQVIEVDGTFVVAQLVSRDEANLEELEKELEKEVHNLALERGYRLYSEWLQERCSALVEDEAVGINKSLMTELSDSQEQGFTYQPFCAK